jgi:hypothetical protein
MDELHLHAIAMGWFACSMSIGLTIASAITPLAAKKRGFLQGENSDPWVTAFVYSVSVTLYCFHKDANSGMPLKIWCMQDMTIVSFEVRLTLQAMCISNMISHCSGAHRSSTNDRKSA